MATSAIGNKKGGIPKKIGFLSSSFMNLCKNIHHSVWQLLGIEKIQIGGHFEKINPLKAQLHMAYDIPTRFHKV
jgi:hypothetical protein